MKELNELLQQEYDRLSNEGWVYFSKPYACSKDEAMRYFEGWAMPKENKYEIAREEKQTTIKIKPLKGSRKRKTYDIKLWVS